jgi:hypothetical protein
MATCVVSYLDIEGLRHSVEVEAETLYEAAVLGLHTLKNHHCAPGYMGELNVEMRTSVTHTVPVKKIHSWLNGGARSPKEAVLKDRLKKLGVARP